MSRTANARRLRPDLQDKRWGGPHSQAANLHVIRTDKRENNDRATPINKKVQSRAHEGQANLIGVTLSGWLMAAGHRLVKAYRISKRLAKGFRDNILMWRYPDWILFGCAIFFGFAVWSWVLR